MSFVLHSLEPFGVCIIAKEGSNKNVTSIIEGKILKGLIQQFHLVVLRGFSAVDKETLTAYAQTLGTLLAWEFGNVMDMRVHAQPTNYLFTHGAVPFHWDGAFHQEPRYLLFHCVEAPTQDAGGETLFTNTHQVWKTAAKKEKEEWRRYHITYKTEKLAHYGGLIRVPLVQEHPDKQEIILRFAEPVPDTMLNPVEVKIENLEPRRSNELLQDLAQRCYSSAHCYTHQWENNDLLLADNHTLIHARHAFKDFSPRHLQRIQIL